MNKIPIGEVDSVGLDVLVRELVFHYPRGQILLRDEPANPSSRSWLTPSTRGGAPDGMFGDHAGAAIFALEHFAMETRVRPEIAFIPPQGVWQVRIKAAYDEAHPALQRNASIARAIVHAIFEMMGVTDVEPWWREFRL